MFDRCYLWTMRHGSRLLFLIALILFVVTLILSVVGLAEADSFSGFGTSQTPARWLLTWLTPLMNALQATVWPMLGAMVIDRLDRNRRDPR